MTALPRDVLATPSTSAAPSTPLLPVLDVLPLAVVLLDRDGEPTGLNRMAQLWGVVREGKISSPRVRRLIRSAAVDGEPVEEDGHLSALPGQEWRRPVRIRIDAVGTGLVLSLEDRSAAESVDAVRRDFMAGLAHELKTPVGALLLLSEAALAANDDAEMREQLTRRMQSEANRLALMVRDVLELARVQGREEALHAHCIEIGAVVDEAIAGARPGAREKDVAIHSAIGAATQVCGNGAQLTDAVRRLLDNAIAVSEAGSQIDVELRRHHGLVDVRVSDRGPGVPATARERVFERFYRVDAARSRRTGGSGIGLAVVKHVAERHGGSAFVRGRPRGGATFVLRLPLAP